MPRRTSCDLCYPTLLAPWQSLANDSVGVIALRLARMPWLWLLDPREAERELNRMVSEKQAAAGETWLALWATPWHFWSDVTGAGAVGTPMAILERALHRAGERLLSPSSGRVGANHRRLARARDAR